MLLDYLSSLESIRLSCNNVLEFAEQNHLLHFNYTPTKLEEVADFVVAVMLRQYPDLDIPIHSRWRHFEVAGVDRFAILKSKVDPQQLLKSSVELVIVSILLDAGTGPQWQYMDHLSNETLDKSEGLAAASFNLFMQGFFSSNRSNLYQADGFGLQEISEDTMAAALQISPKNTLIGLQGRIGLLQGLGVCIQQHPEYFGNSEFSLRLGNIVDYLMKHADGHSISMRVIFSSLLEAFRDIWPGRYIVDNVNLGDVWPYSGNKNDLNPQGLIPFHKLTQWMCYSLIEPIESIGIKITDVNLLTGLPEYRNGGLFVDLQVLTPKNKDAMQQTHSIYSEFVVEWRAMTVALLDKVAVMVAAKLGLNATQLPLAKVLQGGTWMAGRVAASQARADGGPPFLLDSDGTIF